MNFTRRSAYAFCALLALGVSSCSTGSGGLVPDRGELERARACARLSGCEPFASLSEPLFACAGILSSLVTDEAALTRCVLAAADCGAAVDCVGVGAPVASCSSAVRDRCEGDVLYTCESTASRLSIGRDCAADGLRCVLTEFGDAFCGRPEPAPCADSRCEGDTLLWCVGGVFAERSCGAGTCTTLDGISDCAGEGESCERLFARCEGDVAVTCRHGRKHRVQCGVGLCSESDGAFCRTDEACSTRCDGDAIIQCVRAQPTRIPCSQWGYTQCSDVDGEPRCR
ncbi:MAG: hypothetical protein GXP55_19620 [Deltaproteobacteria bacterium]|nr:hypothetical protein [Deltaproteobacteria bacterium]